MVEMNAKNWDKTPRVGDCPLCGADSMPERLQADAIHEEGRCDANEKHLFQAEAVFNVPFKGATIIPH